MPANTGSHNGHSDPAGPRPFEASGGATAVRYLLGTTSTRWDVVVVKEFDQEEEARFAWQGGSVFKAACLFAFEPGTGVLTEIEKPYGTDAAVANIKREAGWATLSESLVRSG